MKKLFGIFVLCIIATTSFSEEMCLRIDGCWIDVKTGECQDCVDVKFMPRGLTNDTTIGGFSTSGTLYVCEDHFNFCIL